MMASHRPAEEFAMTVCPIAIAVGCAKCPAFKICPMTRILGDQKDAKAEAPAGAKDETKGRKKA
jgi:hypothetical protein